MLFNSYEFLFFFIAAFTLYWGLGSRRSQNLFLIAASYVFYGYWDWRFLGLIVASSAVDYIIGLKLHNTTARPYRLRLLLVSIIFNLGVLGFFKYFDFFVTSFAALLESMGLHPNLPLLHVILPVGISFYTFQTMSYTIDIYRRQLEPTRDIAAFFAFVSFFPQLVAGPIERASNLLPQFLRERKFDVDKAKDGLRQILWGFFKKVVVADSCAQIVDICFSSPEGQLWWTYIVGVLAFAIQIYGDFSGYSDIAIGTARLLGFDLMRNFAYPYFSRDVGEFWRRWHISLSTWFRDYVYIPLGGSRVSNAGRIRNIIITFTVSGLWHGASWNFVIWGFLNGVYYIPLMLVGRQKQHTGTVAEGRMLPGLRDLGSMALTFSLICISWIFFRSADLESSVQYFTSMIGITSGDLSALRRVSMDILAVTLLCSIFMVLVEWFNRTKEHGLDIKSLHVVFRWSLYMIVTLLLINYWGEKNTFIYFQF